LLRPSPQGCVTLQAGTLHLVNYLVVCLQTGSQVAQVDLKLACYIAQANLEVLNLCLHLPRARMTAHTLIHTHIPHTLIHTYTQATLPGNGYSITQSCSIEQAEPKSWVPGPPSDHPFPRTRVLGKPLLTSSAVTMAITFTPCSHTICQKSWHVCGKGPWVAM
jgi:hypothetical protein